MGMQPGAGPRLHAKDNPGCPGIATSLPKSSYSSSFSSPFSLSLSLATLPLAKHTRRALVNPSASRRLSMSESNAHGLAMLFLPNSPPEFSSLRSFATPLALDSPENRSDSHSKRYTNYLPAKSYDLVCLIHSKVFSLKFALSLERYRIAKNETFRKMTIFSGKQKGSRLFILIVLLGARFL